MRLLQRNTETWYGKGARIGAVRLDERLPGWHQLIDQEDLEMNSAIRCVAGQLAHKDQRVPVPMGEIPNYGHTVRFIGPAGSDKATASVEYGFNVPGSCTAERGWDLKWKAAWVEEINIRLARDAVELTHNEEPEKLPALA